jgi:drug/metabolite transporter (DMT)-like permease
MPLRIVFIPALGSLCASVGTVLRKLVQPRRTDFPSFINAMIITGLGLYGLGSMFWIYGMSRQKLISVYPFTILSFMIVYLVETLGLGERPTRLGIIGVVLILAALPRRETPRERRRFLMKVIGGRR